MPKLWDDSERKLTQGKNLTASAACVLACGAAMAQGDGNLFPEGNFENTPSMEVPNPNPVHADPLNAQEGVF